MSQALATHPLIHLPTHSPIHSSIRPSTLGQGVHLPLSGAHQLPRGSLWTDAVTADSLRPGDSLIVFFFLIKDLLSAQHLARCCVHGKWGCKWAE